MRALLKKLRCIQLDPLSVIGTNADLVVMARRDDARLGDVYRQLFPKHAFEHFAKERCILPASAFSWYRARMVETPWWRLTERTKRVPESVLAEVLAEVRERGPIAAANLTRRGPVAALDWDGWKGTAQMHMMALEILWTRCEIVVAGRDGRGKIYDVPERALGDAGVARPVSPGAETMDGFARWAIMERVAAAGMLARPTGPQWSMLRDYRKSRVVEDLLRRGELREVQVSGSPRKFLALPEFLDRKRESKWDPDGRVRILGPLDPLLWDRPLIGSAFGFDYVWEVYKPAKQRRWGWYVCPLLREDRLIGRIDAQLIKTPVAKGRGDASPLELRVNRVWMEDGVRVPRKAIVASLERHANMCGAGGRVSFAEKL